VSSNIFENRYRQIAANGGEAWFQESHYKELERHWRQALDGVQGPRLLEIGCGAGLLTPVFTELGFEVTGIDISPLAIESAQARFPHAEFLVCDIQNGLPWPAESFDVALDSDCLHHIPPPGREIFFQEAFRILKPGGTLLIKTNVGAPEEANWERFGYDPKTKTTQIEGQVSNYFADPPDVMKEAERAGFQIESVSQTPPAENTSVQLHLKAKK